MLMRGIEWVSFITRVPSLVARGIGGLYFEEINKPIYILIFSILQRVEQELKENGSLSMVTLMTTPPPLSASSPGVLDSSTSSNGSIAGNYKF